MDVLRFNIHTPVVCNDKITACIGYFDGLHKGHQQLVRKVVDIAKQNNTIPALITFDPDPWVVVKKLRNIPHLTPMKYRQEIGEQLGIKKWIILDFQKDMANLSYEQFHELVLKPLNINTLVCGYDFHYAHRGEGNVKTLLKQSYFNVEVIDEIASEDEKISSTRIERLVKEGDMEKATWLMGRVYELCGVVKSGNRIGRKYGFPTANLKLCNSYVLPKCGVYIGKVLVKNQWYMAIINVGHNPSFNYQDNISIEAYILDFNQMIYDMEVRYQFYAYLRDEKHFDGMDELKQQLTKDVASARAYFQKEGNV